MPMNTRSIKGLTVRSTIDNSREENLFYYPPRGKNVPLVVGLHTWSYDRFNQVDNLLPFCRERRWALLLPEFRGPNLKENPRATQACASRLAMQDIVDAVNFVIGEYSIRKDKIFLVGGSGGGHMALMVGGYAPELLAGISSWCPITDLRKWYYQNPRYAPHIAACCGGPPGSSSKVDREYRSRSPINHIRKFVDLNLSIHHGRYDKSVPYTHTLELVKKLERLSPKRFFFEIFDGGHEIRYEQAFSWFDTIIQKIEAEDQLSG